MTLPHLQRRIRGTALAAPLAIALGIGPVLAPQGNAVRAATLSPGPLATSLLAVQGYAYGYPLVLMNETLAGTTGPTRACGFEGQINSFFHIYDIPGPDFRAVVRPNVDTLYSSAFLDLRSGPQLLDMPAVTGRYVLMALLDAWSNNFAGLGTPSHGEQPGHYLIAGPGWQGATPAGYTRIDAPTNLVWIIGRTEVRGEADVPAVNALQNQYTLRALSGEPGPVDDSPCVPRDPSQTPPAIVDALSGPAYFSRLSDLIAAYPPPASDDAMLHKLATIGVGPYATTPVSQLPGRTQLGLEWGRAKAQRLASIGLAVSGRTAPWTPDPVTIPLGDYGTHYFVRYAVAKIGFGANRNEFAVYQNALQDDRRVLLDGAKTYTITFPASQLPPVTAFWSLTVYDNDGYLTSNALGRYALGSASGLQADANGQVTVYLSHTQPAGTPAANWLPVPDGPFQVTVRLYGPKPAVLDGSWAMPAIHAE